MVENFEAWYCCFCCIFQIFGLRDLFFSGLFVRPFHIRTFFKAPTEGQKSRQRSDTFLVSNTLETQGRLELRRSKVKFKSLVIFLKLQLKVLGQMS